jgi:hypothetical protein
VHGTAYGTYATTPERTFTLEGSPAGFESSPGLLRCFCARCGSVAPGPAGEQRFVPLGSCDGDPGVRPEAHVFVASKAPWFEIHDALPRFDAHPPGMDTPAVAGRAPLEEPGPVRGSCLCSAVTFVITGTPSLARFCHCSRCRKARAAAFASNLLVPDSAVRFTRGESRLVSYKVPGARYLMQCFCGLCGGKLPRLDPERKLAVVPMGALDDDPGIRPGSHIFTGSKAAWDEIGDGLPQYTEAPA